MANVKLTVERLQPGLHIRLPLKWNEHPFLLNSFKIKDQQQIDVIRSLGIKFVYLNPAQSDTEPLPFENINNNEDAASDQTPEDLNEQSEKMWQEKQKRIEKLSNYRRRVIQCEKEFERSLARMRAVMAKIRNRPADAVGEAKSLVEDIVEKLLCDDNVTLHLMNGKSEFEDIYFHSMNVAVLSLMIGKSKGFTAEQLQELSFASLFHDIGKIKVPSAILRKQTPLTDPELNYLKLHTKYGLDIAEQAEDFPESAKLVIAQHHEHCDGSGYPDGLKEAEISEYAQVVAVANAFDNLCHHMNPAEQKIPYTALSHIYKNCKSLYNLENLNILIKFMGVFPPGTIVQLSNDMVGLVISVNSSSLLHPNVLIYDPSVPRTQAPILDLADRDLKIVNAIHPAKLPDKVKDYLNPRSRISYFLDSDS